jgi:glycosyltransferase involved in cell wall biosynthesis
MPLVLNEFPQARLLIVGGGTVEAQKHLFAQIDRLGLQHCIRYLGARDDVPALLALTEVFVISSLWEGFCCAIAEAMVAGKPVVTTDIIGPREVVARDETALVVPPRDAGALAKAIVTVLRNPDLGREMGRRGRARALELYSAERMGREYTELYLSLARAKGLLSDRSRAQPR